MVHSEGWPWSMKSTLGLLPLMMSTCETFPYCWSNRRHEIKLVSYFFKNCYWMPMHVYEILWSIFWGAKALWNLIEWTLHLLLTKANCGGRSCTNVLDGEPWRVQISMTMFDFFLIFQMEWACGSLFCYMAMTLEFLSFLIQYI